MTRPPARGSSTPAPVTRLRGASAYLGTPALLARKLIRAGRRRRVETIYRDRLAAGAYLPHAGAADHVDLTVAMPVYRVSEEHLRAAIASVRAQSHPNWRLLMLDDAAPEPHVGRVLADAARDDPRITTLRRTVNGGIAVASNELLAAARTEFVAFLDHDDLLHPHALGAVAAFLAAHPETDWLYTDEDKVDERGRHSGPLFKPGFSRIYLMALNLVSHLRVVRKTVAEEVGAHRTGFEGAQDYDLALRVLAGGGRFAHLPGVLYHWRATAGSMASGAAAKPAANAAAARALTEYLGQIAPAAPGTFEPWLGPASIFRLRMPTPTTWPDLAMLPAQAPAAGSGDHWTQVIASARTAAADHVALAPAGTRPERLHGLLPYLTLPGVAIAAARLTAARRVAASGWVVGDDGAWHDPWRGLAATDPGYLNLAAVTSPRHLPSPVGWVARRDLLVQAWDAAPDVPSGQRLAVGLARSGLDAVVDPAVSLRSPGEIAGGPPEPPPSELSPAWRAWAYDLGLLP